MIELAGGLGYSAGNASLTGPGKKSVEHELLDLRFVERIGRRRRRRACAVGSRFRHARLDYLPVLVVRSFRNAPKLRPCQPFRIDGYCVDMDKLGPMCRTADDCGLVLSVIAGHDPRDHDSRARACHRIFVSTAVAIDVPPAASLSASAD